MKKTIKRFFILGMISLGTLSLIGCGTNKLDISNAIDLKYGAYNGEANFYTTDIKYDKLNKIPELSSLNKKMVNGDYKVELVSDKTNFKNGDKVRLILNYNKELYKKEFGYELDFEPKEITIEGLPDKLTEVNQLSKEQWNEVYSSALKQAEIIAKENNYTDIHLMLVRKKIVDYVDFTIDFIFSVKNNKNETRYMNFLSNLSFKRNNDLNPIEIKTSALWNNVLESDYSNLTLNELLSKYYGGIKFETIWSSENN